MIRKRWKLGGLDIIRSGDSFIAVPVLVARLD